MPTLDVVKLDGTKAGTIDLDDAVFGAEVREHLLWEVVRNQRANKRAGTHCTKRQDEVRGGGKKPYRQKGTGRARQGSSRAPQFVGGGGVFTPKPRDYSYVLPKKVRRGALRSALSLRVRDGRLIVVDAFDLDAIKTQRVAQALGALGAPRALIVDAADNERLSLSTRNLEGAKYLAAEGLNVYDVLKHEALVITTRSAKAVETALRP